LISLIIPFILDANFISPPLKHKSETIEENLDFEWNSSSNYQKTLLADASRKAMLNFFEEKSPSIDKNIHSAKSIYVTLRKKGELVGCQSNRIDSENLVTKVADATIHALKDSRFSELGKNELDEVSIEINILGDFSEIYDKNIESLKERIELGLDGIKILNGEKEALFLPAVPVKNDYGLEKTLERLCLK